MLNLDSTSWTLDYLHVTNKKCYLTSLNLVDKFPHYPVPYFWCSDSCVNGRKNTVVTLLKSTMEDCYQGFFILKCISVPYVFNQGGPGVTGTSPFSTAEGITCTYNTFVIKHIWQILWNSRSNTFTFCYLSIFRLIKSVTNICWFNFLSDLIQVTGIVCFRSIPDKDCKVRHHMVLILGRGIWQTDWPRLAAYFYWFWQFHNRNITVRRWVGVGFVGIGCVDFSELNGQKFVNLIGIVQAKG